MGNGALSWEQSLPLTWVSNEWAAITTGIFPTHTLNPGEFRLYFHFENY